MTNPTPDRDNAESLIAQAERALDGLTDRVLPVSGNPDIGLPYVAALALLAVHAELRHGHDTAASRFDPLLDHYVGQLSATMGRMADEIVELKDAVRMLTARLDG